MAEDRQALARQAGFSDEEIAAYEAEREQSFAQAARRGEDPYAAARRPPSSGLEPGGPPVDVSVAQGLTRGLLSPEAKLRYYKSRFGEGNVDVLPSGEVKWREPGGDWKLAEEDDFLGSVVGLLPELLGMGAGVKAAKLAGKGATAFGRMRGAAAGGAGGALVKEHLGEAVTGEEVPLEATVGDVAGAAAAGFVGQGAGELVGAPTLNPAAAASRAILRSEDTGFGQAMRGAQQRQEFPLSLYQETGTPIAKALEGFTGRTAFGRLAAARLPVAQDTAARARAERLLGELERNPAALADESFGISLAETGSRATKDVLDAMEEAGKTYFSFRSQVLGKEKMVVPSQWRQTLLERVEELTHHGDRASMRAAAELDRLANDPAFQFGMSPATVQHLLAQYNRRSYGKEGDKLFETLDNASSVELTKKLHEALKTDLLKEAEGTGLSRAASIALRQGLETYSSEAALLSRLRNTPLLQLLDKHGLLKELRSQGELVGAEHIPQALIKGMMSGTIAPSEIRNTVRLLQATSPDVASSLAGYVINNALVAGRIAGETLPWKFSREAFEKTLPPPQYLQAIFQDAWNPGRRTTGLRISADLAELGMLIRRSAEKIGVGIPESPTTTLGALIHKLVKSPLAALGQIGYKIVAPYEISAVMTDPTARAATQAWMERIAKQPTWRGPGVRGKIGQFGVAPAAEAALLSGGGEPLQEEF